MGAGLHIFALLTYRRAGSCVLPLRMLGQAVFVVHRTRAAVMLADMEAPSTVTVRLINYTPSDLHIRQLKSSTIGGCVDTLSEGRAKGRSRAVSV